MNRTLALSSLATLSLAAFSMAILSGCAASPPPQTDALRGPGPYSWVCQGDDSRARSLSVPIAGKTVQVRGTIQLAEIPQSSSGGNSRRGSQAGVHMAHEPQAVIALGEPLNPDAKLMLRAPSDGTPWLASLFKSVPRDNTVFARIQPSQTALPFEIVLTPKGVIGASIAGHVAPWVLPGGHPDHLGLSCSGSVRVSFSNVAVSP